MCLSEEDLLRYADGELAEPARREAVIHLASCSRCAGLAAALATENDVLRDVLAAPWPLPELRLARVGAQAAASVALLLGARWAVVGFDELSLLSMMLLVADAFMTALRVVSYPIALIVSLAFLGATARIAIRRRAAAAMVALLVLHAQTPSAAMERRTGSDATVKAGETINGSVFAAGPLVRIAGRVNGNVLATGTTVEVTGVITGRLIALAENVTVSGSVGGLQVFGRELRLLGETGGWLVFAENVQLGAKGRATGAGTTMSETLTIEGTTAAPLRAFGGRLTIGPGARLEQRFAARVNEAQISPAALLPADRDVRVGPAARLSPAALTARASVLALAFVIGAWWWFRRRGWLLAATEDIAGWWPNLMRGGAALVATLVVGMALAITIIGLPLAAVVLAVLAVTCVAALAIAATFIAVHLLPNRDTPFLWRLVLALVLLGIASLPGYGIGATVTLVTVLAGLGALAVFPRRAAAVRPPERIAGARPYRRKGGRCMATITLTARRAGLGLTAVLLVLSAAAATAQDTKAFDPGGRWQGPCVGKDRGDRTLQVSFTRVDKAWRATGNLATPGYPDGESEFDEVKVTGDNVSFVGLWGPMVAEFTGVHKGGRLDGSVKLVREQQTVMSCSWSLSRVAAK